MDSFPIWTQGLLLSSSFSLSLPRPGNSKFFPSLTFRLCPRVWCTLSLRMIFRQFEGLFPMPVYFEVGVPQTFAWTLLSRYITSCPGGNKPIEWNVSGVCDLICILFSLRLTLDRSSLPCTSSTGLPALMSASNRKLTPTEALVSISHYTKMILSAWRMICFSPSYHTQSNCTHVPWNAGWAILGSSRILRWALQPDDQGRSSG